MVTVTVFAEGGTVDSGGVDAATMDNSAALRQSLNRIFSETIGKRIVVEMKAGYKNVCKEFLKKSDVSLVMYLDSDCVARDIPKWFEKMSLNDHITIPDDRRNNIYFMVQEMEAWILKDLHSLELWAEKEGYERKDVSPLSQHSLVRGKNIESIKKPSKNLALMVKHFFSRNKKKVKYEKLKNAPAILDCIDVGTLKAKDAELTRFSTTF